MTGDLVVIPTRVGVRRMVPGHHLATIVAVVTIVDPGIAIVVEEHVLLPTPTPIRALPIQDQDPVHGIVSLNLLLYIICMD